MILTPVNGLPNILVDIDAMKAYVHRRGFLHELSIRQPFGKISLVANGKTYGTTIYRLVWAAQKGIDYNKIPSNYCFSFADAADKGRLRNVRLSSLLKEERITNV